MINFLNTTNRNIAWFKGAFDRGELDMKPPFQRNPVWVTKQKSYLIDTILNEYPIPEIYMQETVDEHGKAKYIIVDGQQRTRAVLEFLEGKYCIDPKDSPKFGDMYFDDLSIDRKKSLYNYNFVIRVLPDVPDIELRSIFQRLNKNVVSLNRQELRQATYWGPFIETMKQLSDKEVWGYFRLFTPNDIRRMLDVEYISELAIAVLHGLQNKKDNVDKFYELYEEEFDQKESLIDIFETVTGELVKVLPNVSKTRWSKKTDFYTLFILFAKNHNSLPLSKGSRQVVINKLEVFSDELNNYVKVDKEYDTSSFSEQSKLYAKGIRASTDLGSRKNREEGLKLQLGNIWDN